MGKHDTNRQSFELAKGKEYELIHYDIYKNEWVSMAEGIPSTREVMVGGSFKIQNKGMDSIDVIKDKGSYLEIMANGKIYHLRQV